MATIIGGKTQLTGLLGWPVSHSLSPAMHNAAAAALGLDLVYLPLEVHPEQLEVAVRGLGALGFVGANVTVPHKQAVLPLLDEVDPAAAAIGAVNTIVISRQLLAVSGQPPGPTPQPPAAGGSPVPDPRSPLLIGYNTDWTGLLADLEQQSVELAGRDCLILGAGGSSRAVAYALASTGGRVHVFARRPEQARKLVAELAAHCPSGSLVARGWSALEDAPGTWPMAALIVNTTPLGMTPHVERTPWPEATPFPAQAFVYDLVYNPAETQFMRQAQAAGLKASNGLGMLLRQGALAFELWTGRKPDLEVMAEALHAGP